MNNHQIKTAFEGASDYAYGDNLSIGQSGTVDGALFVFDEQEAKGKILLERGGYGLYIWIDGKCRGLIDLFHQSIEGREIDEMGREQPGYPQIVIYAPEEDDTLAYVAWLPDGTVETIFDRDNLPVRREGLTTAITYQP